MGCGPAAAYHLPTPGSRSTMSAASRVAGAVGATDVITRHRDGDVEVIRIDRHERRNALDVEHCQALREAVRAATDDAARAIVITGAGSSFCAGADLGTVYGNRFRDALYGMLAAITQTPVPVLASVNGAAIGAGTQLAIACDLRVAAPTARFAIPTARNGLAVDPWTIRRLALLAGGGVARAVLIGCDTLNALFEPAINDTELLKAFDACWTSEDLEEGDRARREGRPPRFRGR